MRRLALIFVTVGLFAVGAPAQAGPGDPLRAKQWGLDVIQAEQAWKVTRGRGALVAVLSTGADMTHEDLKGQLATGRDIISPGQPPQDDEGPGTRLIGVVVARRNNGRGIAGVAPEARAMPVRVGEGSSPPGPFLGIGAYADPDSIAVGVRYAVDRRVRVVLIPAVLGPNEAIERATTPVTGGVYLTQLFDALAYAASRGVVVIAPSGHDQWVLPGCALPAPTVCVGAVDRRSVPATYSRTNPIGDMPFVCGPGGLAADAYPIYPHAVDEDVVTTSALGGGYEYDGDGYVWASGTPIAAAHVAGVAALLLSRGFKAAQLIDRLTATATDVGPPGRDAFCGSGLVNAARAVGA